MSQFLSMFNSVGPAAFSQMACQVAPYFSTINPEIAELRPGHAVANGPHKDELLTRNKQRNRQLTEWMSDEGRREAFSHIPAELLLSLIIGSAESYARAWLSGRVKKSPKDYAQLLAQAAWASINAPDI